MKFLHFKAVAAIVKGHIYLLIYAKLKQMTPLIVSTSNVPRVTEVSCRRSAKTRQLFNWVSRQSITLGRDIKHLADLAESSPSKQ